MLFQAAGNSSFFKFASLKLYLNEKFDTVFSVISCQPVSVMAGTPSVFLMMYFVPSGTIPEVASASSAKVPIIGVSPAIAFVASGSIICGMGAFSSIVISNLLVADLPEPSVTITFSSCLPCLCAKSVVKVDVCSVPAAPLGAEPFPKSTLPSINLTFAMPEPSFAFTVNVTCFPWNIVFTYKDAEVPSTVASTALISGSLVSSVNCTIPPVPLSLMLVGRFCA